MKNITTTPHIVLTAFLFLLIIGTTGCKDELTAVGTDLMPVSEFATPKTLDLTQSDGRLKAFNLIDPIRTDDADYGMIGTYKDPLFGTLKADFLAQFAPSERNPTMRAYKDKTGFKVDSLILKITFKEKDWYGDSSAVHKIKIYELTGDLTNEEYLSNMSVDGLYNTTPIAEINLKASDGYKRIMKDTIITVGEIKDTIQTWTGKYQWYSDSLWVIQMSSELTEKFANYSINSTASCDLQSLKNTFNGFYITSDLQSTDKSSIVKTNLKGSTGLLLKLNASYYTKAYSSVKKDSILVRHQVSTSYYPSIDCKRINRFTHETSSNIRLNDESIENQNLYLQGMAGSYATVKIDTSYLYSFKDSLKLMSPKYLLSAGNLVFKIDTLLSEPKVNYPPSFLTVIMKDSNGNPVEAPIFIAGAHGGYIFANNFSYNDNSNYGLAVYIRNDYKKIYEYQFKLNPFYLDALLAYKDNPNSLEFGDGGKFEGFTEKDPDTGAFKYIYELNEVVIKPSEGEYNLRRVVLKSPQSGKDPLKLNIKYYTYNPTVQ